jgi:uncharacterized protein (TIGR01777 family)
MDRILLTGATGFIGQALLKAWQGNGEIAVLTQSGPRAVASLGLSPELIFDDADAAAAYQPNLVVHLAGAGIADARWTAKRRAALWASRADYTRGLVDALRKAPPARMIAASAIGYYGPAGDPPVDETAPRGAGFAAALCEAWETESRALEGAGTAVCCLRLGLVLGPRGGLLGRLAPPFRLGLGGRMGDGAQGMSWIHRDDVLGLLSWLRAAPTLPKTVNGTAPHPVSNDAFTRALGRALHRPTPFPLPAALVKGLFGQMGEELLLGGPRVLPKVAEVEGFKFRFPTLPEALEDIF